MSESNPDPEDDKRQRTIEMVKLALLFLGGLVVIFGIETYLTGI